MYSQEFLAVGGVCVCVCVCVCVRVRRCVCFSFGIMGHVLIIFCHLD